MDLLKKQAHNANMSLIIGLKCVDGIIIGSDSRISKELNGTYFYSGEAQKIFKGRDFVVGFYNLFEVNVTRMHIGGSHTEKIFLNEAIKEFFNPNMDFKDFMSKLLNYLDDDAYEFILGLENKLYKGVIANKIMHLELKEKIAMNECKLGYTNDFYIEKEINILKAKELIKKMISTIKIIQSNLLNYQSVGGDIQIEVLKP